MSTTVIPTHRSIAQLQEGEVLSRDEFEELYHRTPEKFKAELIEGVVHVASPVSVEFHGIQDALIQGWFGYYRVFTPHVASAGNGSFRMDENNEVQPDSMLYRTDVNGANSFIDDEGFINGVPELLAEIANSSIGLDLGKKKRVYEKHGIPEYLVWNVQENTIHWFGLLNGRYEPLLPDSHGNIKSRIFPGLWLNVPALLIHDLKRVFETVQQGCQTAEHAAFVALLSK